MNNNREKAKKVNNEKGLSNRSRDVSSTVYKLIEK